MPMFGIRVLIYLLGIALVIWILIRLARKPRVDKQATRRVGDMVRCTYCDTYVPRQTAIQDGDRYYCCSRHRDEDREQ